MIEWIPTEVYLNILKQELKLTITDYISTTPIIIGPPPVGDYFLFGDGSTILFGDSTEVVYA